MTPQPSKPVALGACLALLSVLLGFGLGGWFGAYASDVKKYLEKKGADQLNEVYRGNVAEKDAMAKKGWDYLMRAHLHGGAIGAAGLASIAILLVMCRPGRLVNVTALALLAGALMYSVYWLWAGLITPGIGSATTAKESLGWLAIPGAGLCLLGVVGTLVCVAKDVLLRRSE